MEHGTQSLPFQNTQPFQEHIYNPRLLSRKSHKVTHSDWSIAWGGIKLALLGPAMSNKELTVVNEGYTA